MKRIVNLIQIVLGGIGLVALVVLLNGMFQQQAAVTAARRTPTAASFKPTPKATKPAKVDWENATLEQIKFGKTRTILKQNAQIKIWSWLPDNRRLLLELLDPEAKDVESAFRIITLDVKTGEIVEYGRRGDGATAPELIEQTESAVYLYSNWQTGQGPQTRIGGTDGKVQQMTEGYAAYSVHPRTGEIYYRVAGTQPNSLRLLDPSQHELTPRILFPSLSLPPGSPLIDPKGRTMAIVGSPEWGMLNLVTGQFQAFAVAAQVKNGTATGTSSEKWSPNGKQIAFTFTQDPNFDIALVPPLSLFDATTGKVQSAKLPIPGVVEFDWSPKGRFLLVKGANPKGVDAQHIPYPNTFWLVDARDQTFKALDYFPTINDGTQTWMAWNGKGQLAWVKNVPEGLALVITQIAPER